MTIYLDQVVTAFDSSGNTIAGAKLYFYENNTTTPQDIYLDEDLTTPSTNPAIADGNGRFDRLYLLGEAYSVEYTDADDVTIETWDDVTGGAGGVNSVTAVSPLINTGSASDVVLEIDPNSDLAADVNTNTWLHFA